jgi:hypothetical protein
MRNTDFSIIDPVALAGVSGGCKQKQAPPPPQQPPQQMAPPPPQDCGSDVTVEVATGAQALQRINGATGAQPGASQAPKLI